MASNKQFENLEHMLYGYYCEVDRGALFDNIIERYQFDEGCYQIKRGRKIETIENDFDDTLIRKEVELTDGTIFIERGRKYILYSSYLEDCIQLFQKEILDNVNEFMLDSRKSSYLTRVCRFSIEKATYNKSEIHRYKKAIKEMDDDSKIKNLKFALEELNFNEIQLEHLNSLNQFLEFEFPKNFKLEKSRNSTSKISLTKIALLHYYNGEKITIFNASQIANINGFKSKTSGDQLLKKYYSISGKKENGILGGDSKKQLKHRVREIEFVLEKLTDKQQLLKAQSHIKVLNDKLLDFI